MVQPNPYMPPGAAQPPIPAPAPQPIAAPPQPIAPPPPTVIPNTAPAAVGSSVARVNRDIARYGVRNLKSQGQALPCTSFVGFCQAWDIGDSPFGDDSQQYVFDFTNVMVTEQLKDQDPFFGKEISMPVKYSESARSAFGMFGRSLADAQGVPYDAHDLDGVPGNWFHIVGEKYNWGKIPNSQSADSNGDTWGTVYKAYVASAEQINTAQGQPAAVPATASTAVVTPALTVAVAAPTDHREHAATLLNGKSKQDWISALANDDIIKSDPIVMGEVMQDTFYTGILPRFSVDATTGIHTQVS